MSFITRPVNNSQTKTLQEFIIRLDLLNPNGARLQASELIDVTDDTGITNRQRIKDSYNGKAKSAPEGQEETLIYPDTIISIPIQFFRRDTIISQGNFLFRYKPNFKTFLGEKIEKLIKSPIYTKAPEKNKIQSQYQKYSLKPQVFIWCRGAGVYPEGAILDISDFIGQVSTNITESGGNFTITLPPITAKYESTADVGTGTNTAKGNLTIAKSGINYYTYNNNGSYYAKDSILTFNKDGEQTRNNFFFHNLINPNDIVFIAFEPLFGENRLRDKNSLNVPFNDLPFFTTETGKQERIFDLIGLVDKNTISYQASSTDVSISISGRDLMKLIIEDGEYFFPLEFAGTNIYGIFNNTINENTEKYRSLRRVEGKLMSLNAFVDNTIGDALSFVFSQLSHIEICPSGLFDAYGDERSKYVYPKRTEVVDNGNNSQKWERIVEIEEIFGAGIWQIIKIIIDDDGSESSLKNRRLVDASIATEQGGLINFVRKICQNPFVEFWGDTYGNQYYFIARRPPFTQSSILDFMEKMDNIQNIHIKEADIISENLTFSDSPCYSWYKIEPKGNFLGNGTQFTLAYLPAIFFPEFAEIFGNKALQVSSNYIDYFGLQKMNDNTELDYLQNQAIEDLRFVVETNVYLPFTRQGTITLKGEHRRIKRGMWIRHLGTKELFYVDGCQNSYTINEGTVERTTTLNVSRGMVDKIQTDGTKTLEQYFKIVDYEAEGGITQIEINKTPPTQEGGTGNTQGSPEPIDNTQLQTKESGQLIINWQINKSVLEYLIKRRQFSE